MNTKSYLMLSGALTLILVLGLLFVPALAQVVEQWLLLFLSTNAR